MLRFAVCDRLVVQDASYCLLKGFGCDQAVVFKAGGLWLLACRWSGCVGLGGHRA